MMSMVELGKLVNHSYLLFFVCGLTSRSTIFQSCLGGFLGLTTTMQWRNVTCSRPQQTGTRPGFKPGTPRPLNHNKKGSVQQGTLVKSMQRSGTEAIRTQLQPSKLKREITNITNSQNTKITYGQPSGQPFPKR